LIRATLVSVVLLAAVAADEGIDTLTSNAWWIPVFPRRLGWQMPPEAPSNAKAALIGRPSSDWLPRLQVTMSLPPKGKVAEAFS
jgi:hypothetical protein